MASPVYRMCLLGDVMLGRLVDQALPSHVENLEDAFHVKMLFRAKNPNVKLPVEHKYVWGNVLEDIKSADVRIINLETSVTTHPVKYPEKAFNYRMHPNNLKCLKEANVEYASLANNHTLDFSNEGLYETLSSLSKFEIAFAGAGRNKEEAQRPAVFTAKGKKIACFSAADHYDFWFSGPNKPGINYLDVDNFKKEDIDQIKAAVKDVKAKENPDFVVFSLHWGSNYCWQPHKQKQEFAHRLIDECGVDVIHGHSSHHIQGIEVYKGKPIVYGSGDFVDDYAVDKEYRNDLGFAYFINWNENKTVQNIELVPTKIECCQVLKAGEQDKKWLFNTLQRLCQPFHTQVALLASGNFNVTYHAPTAT